MILILIQLISLAAVGQAFNTDAIRAFDEFLIKAIEDGEVPDIHSIPTIPPPARSVTGDGPRNRLPNPWTSSNTTRDNSTAASSRIFRRINNEQDDSDVLGSLLQQRYSQRSQRQSRRPLTKRDLEVGQAFELRNSYREIPYQRWPCCLLGNLAGDKGFICVARFYESRLQHRISNRVHNRRLDFSSAGTWTIYESFQRCVVDDHDANVWQGCCEEAYEATRMRHSRWEQFRAAVRSRDEL